MRNMNIQSLGYRTDLIFPRFDGEVLDRGDYIVIRTPANPTFYWGNFLLFPTPPAAGDFDRWRQLFDQEIGVPPVTNHLAFGWDTVQGETGDLEPFLAAGFGANTSVVLTACEVRRPPKYNPEIVVRRITEDWEWEGALEVQIACRKPEHGLESYRAFKARQMARWRAMSEAGLGKWFGAFLRDRVVGDLGVFTDGDVGRFQSVGTHPECRRQGICGALVFEAARHAFEQMGAKTLVMVADENYHAAKIYESVGFRSTERQIGIDLWKRDTV
jgi:ribosomal protein S18 acetylase RimI-like enzyme